MVSATAWTAVAMFVSALMIQHESVGATVVPPVMSKTPQHESVSSAGAAGHGTAPPVAQQPVLDWSGGARSDWIDVTNNDISNCKVCECSHM